MGKICKAIMLLSLTTLLASCDNSNNFTSVTDATTIGEYEDKLQSIKMFKPNSDDTISGTLDGNIKVLSVFNIGLEGSIKGRNVSKDYFSYELILQDDNKNNIVNFNITSSSIMIKTYDYSVNGVDISSDSSTTEAYDFSILSSIFLVESFSFYELLNPHTTGGLSLKSSKNDDELIILIDELSTITSIVNGFNDADLKEIISSVSEIYLGPSLDNTNTLTGLYALGTVHYYVDISFDVNVKFNA